MISKKYYVSANLKKLYLGGKVNHFLKKEPVVVVESYDYVIEDGDTMYSLASRIFGEDNQNLWTIIADINPIRLPDDWRAGETIKLPLTIVSETKRQIRKYGGQ